MESNFDFKKFVAYFNSKKNIIKTRECRRLLEQLDTWELYRQGGAVIFGRSGLGKTTAMELLIRERKKQYGEKCPVYIMTLSDQDASGRTEKYFYGRILDSMHHNNGETLTGRTMTASASKKRIINVMSTDAALSGQNVAILIIDEAQYMSDSRYSWLKGIYDDLARSGEDGVRLITYLIGMDEMHQIRNRYIRSEELNYIANRFMRQEFEFSGVKERASLQMILMDIENMDYEVDEEKIDVFKTLFPKAAKSGKSLGDLAEPLWNAFIEYSATKKHGKVYTEISMKNVMMAITYIFLNYSAFSQAGEKWPGAAAIKSAVNNTGFVNFE